MHLEVWIEHDFSIDIINEADREVSAKLSPPRFVQKATSQSGPHDVQLGFTHGALQTEKQAIVDWSNSAKIAARFAPQEGQSPLWQGSSWIAAADAFIKP